MGVLVVFRFGVVRKRVNECRIGITKIRTQMRPAIRNEQVPGVQLSIVAGRLIPDFLAELDLRSLALDNHPGPAVTIIYDDIRSFHAVCTIPGS